MYTNKRYGLTLLTILIFGSAVIGLPYTIPIVHATSNTNLFVSAEHVQHNNHFSDSRVIKVVVSDPDIHKLNQQYGEPLVTVNGKRLRMMQATDGNWYAYFADRNQAIASDKTSSVGIRGVNFGTFCGTSGDTFAANLKTGLSFAETMGYTVATKVTGSLEGSTVSNPITNSCLATGGITGVFLEDVIRHYKTINTNPNGFGLGLNMTAIGKVWPIIQLYDFSTIPSTVTVDYQKAGGDQVVHFTFDDINKIKK
ncbi:exported protein of unknown function [Nitrosotalea devaniterrae]|uniref:Uncharacterized protein n=1 Tax=Nitrosotalea devaniterrae TaxID=1078905 RepID=A0A128A0Y9_9ARCH|nr:exported protein of unknown function [Candidatus Nitrosotalea devanaterra]